MRDYTKININRVMELFSRPERIGRGGFDWGRWAALFMRMHNIDAARHDMSLRYRLGSKWSR